MTKARHALLLASLVLLGLDATAAGAASKTRKAAQPAAVPVAASPCTDFYAMAEGSWLNAHPAPPAGSVSAFDDLLASARQQERTLLEQMASSPADDASRALGTLWTDGMNEAAIEAAGVAPLQPLFARIAQAHKSRDIASVVADLHAAGVPVLFNFASDIDLKDFDHQLGYASQGGLGLPDPDYYTRADADTRALLGRYRAYVQTILQLSGTSSDKLAIESGWVLSIETQLAQASLPLVQLRDPNNTYHPVTLAELQKAYPNLALDKFLRAQHADDDRVSLAHTGFFTAADGMLASVPVEQWQAYLRFHVASALAPYLSRGFQDAHYQMYAHLLDGAQQPPERAQVVLDAVDRAFGEAMGHAYAQRYLTPASKDAANHIADGLRAAARDAIARNTWMDDPTRAAAQAKLDKLQVQIGEPASGYALNGVALAGGNFAGDMLSAAAWRHQRDMAAIGKRTSERRWPVFAQVPDVSYDLVQNRIIVSAAFLQPPAFDARSDLATQFGGLGTLIGHQLHYAFDSKGRTIDADGQLHDWWSPLASTSYEQRSAPLISQYDAYPVQGEVKVDGHQTRDENIADLGGLELAWAAFQAASPGVPTAQAEAPGSKTKGAHRKPTATAVSLKGGSSTAREFFDAFAHEWARNVAPANATTEAASSIQAPAMYRVNGPLANLPGFGRTYACKAGQPLQLAAPVAIWR